MNWLDISLLCLAVIGFMKGLSDGFIRQVVSLIALFASIYFCAEVAGWVKIFLLELDWFPRKIIIIGSYVFAFILIVGVIVLTGEIIHRVLEATPFGLFNHLAGGGLGLVFVLVFASLSVNLLELVDHKSSFISEKTKRESRFYHAIEEILPTIYPNDLFIKGE